MSAAPLSRTPAGRRPPPAVLAPTRRRRCSNGTRANLRLLPEPARRQGGGRGRSPDHVPERLSRAPPRRRAESRGGLAATRSPRTSAWSGTARAGGGSRSSGSGDARGGRGAGPRRRRAVRAERRARSACPATAAGAAPARMEGAVLQRDRDGAQAVPGGRRDADLPRAAVAGPEPPVAGAARSRLRIAGLAGRIARRLAQVAVSCGRRLVAKRVARRRAPVDRPRRSVARASPRPPIVPSRPARPREARPSPRPVAQTWAAAGSLAVGDASRADGEGSRWPAPTDAPARRADGFGPGAGQTGSTTPIAAPADRQPGPSPRPRLRNASPPPRLPLTAAACLRCGLRSDASRPRCRRYRRCRSSRRCRRCRACRRSCLRRAQDPALPQLPQLPPPSSRPSSA